MNHPRWRLSLRRHLIAGLIVIAPVTATIWVLTWIFQVLDGLIGRYVYRALGLAVGREELVVPGLGLIALFLLLVSTGWMAERAIGGRILKWWNETLDRLPVVRRIYGASNRIVRSVFGTESRPFNTVVFCEYPTEGRWSVGFLAGNSPDVAQPLGTDLVTVFIPTTPNPTTGFLIMVDRRKVVTSAMSMDEAFTFILSAGAVHPGAVTMPAGLGAEARAAAEALRAAAAVAPAPPPDARSTGSA